MKLSVFTVMLPDLTPEAAAMEMAKAGYSGVEWRVTVVPPDRKDETPSFWGNNLCTFAPTEDAAREAREVAADAGLEIPTLGTYIAMGDLVATENAMKFANIAGAKAIRVGTGRTGDAPYWQLFEQTRAFLINVEKLSQEYGIKANIEMHHMTISASASAAFRLVDGRNPEHVGVIFDAGNMVHEGFEDYRLGVELLGPYLAHVHIKNASFAQPEQGGVWKATWSPLADGVVDWDALFSALIGSGYDGWLGIEDFSQEYSSIDALANAVRFLTEVIERNS